jgi:hypothetical protein
MSEVPLHLGRAAGRILGARELGGLADYFQVDMLAAWYKFVNFGAEENLG